MSEAERAHSEFGGSSASRWLNCPGSVALARTTPPPPPSRYALEGTAAHNVAEFCLTNWIEDVTDLRVIPAAVEKQISGEFPELTNELIEAVQIYVSDVLDTCKESSDCELYVEEQFTLPIGEEGEVYGHNDAIVYSRTLATVWLWDYKHGAGQSVAAEDNPQAKFYVVGALLARDWPVEKIVVRIVQPRAWDVTTHGAIRQWEMSPLDVFEFLGEIETGVVKCKDAAEMIVDCVPAVWQDAFLRSGSWCRWCPAAAVCNIVEKNFLKEAQLDAAGVDVSAWSIKTLPDPRSIDTARIAAIMRSGLQFEAWIASVREYAQSLAETGVNIPGYKLVDKQARRKYLDDPAAVAGYLEIAHGFTIDEAMPRKLATITDIERKLAARITDKEELKQAKEDFSFACTVKESSGLSFVPESDKRAPVNPIRASDVAGVSLLPGA